MGLGDMAKELQKEEQREEVIALRRMRKFVAEHDYPAMNRRWTEIGEMDKNRKTAEDKWRLVKAMKEAKRDRELAKLYTATLQEAEKAERRTKGGGGQFYAENKARIQAAEGKIGAEAKEWQAMQVSIFEEKAVGEGDTEKGNGTETV